ncbi:MAG: hypothetical protein O3A88_04955 [Proteobacteria bacterium]|nr:hypothetical protein [Pseudomonadota bacterium]
MKIGFTRAQGGLSGTLGLAAAIAIGGLSMLGAGPAEAATISFSGLTGGCGGTPGASHTENGITAVGIGGGLSSLEGPGAHLDPSGTPCSQGVSLTTDRRFNPVSAAIQPVTTPFGITAYCSQSDVGDCAGGGEPYDNVLMQGYRAASLVASDRFFLGTSPFAYAFGEAFRNIDALQVFALDPDFAQLGGVCLDAPCAHFNLTSVEISPVPFPAAGWMFVSALARLGLMRRKAGDAA